MDISTLIDAAARAAVEHAEAGEDAVTTFSWPHFIGRMTEAGEITLAAKALLHARQMGSFINGTPEVEVAARRMQAQRGAETFRAVNKANHTNHPLPAWIRNELGESE